MPKISSRHHKLVRNAARVAAENEHREICGIFFERGGYLHLERKRNRTSRSMAFIISQRDLREAKAKSAGIWGAFHSHAIGEAVPSIGDVSSGPDNGHAMIYDVIGDEFRLWRIRRRQWHLVKRFDFDRG